MRCFFSMPVTYDLYGDRSGNTRNVLVEPNRVSWLKRHFARIRYGPRSGTGRIPFCRRAAWYGRCVHPTSTLWRSNCLLGSGSGAPNGLVCYSARRGVVLTIWHSSTAYYRFNRYPVARIVDSDRVSISQESRKVGGGHVLRCNHFF